MGQAARYNTIIARVQRGAQEIECILSNRTDDKSNEERDDVQDGFECNYYTLTTNIEQVIAEYEREHDTQADPQFNLVSVYSFTLFNHF